MRSDLLLLIAAVGLGATLAAAAQSDTSAGAAAQAGAPAAAARALPEVTVRASRAKLWPKVSSFVNGITDVENGYGLARWQTPVCPLVSGLNRQEGEFILERVTEVARAAAVPLAGEQCHANLLILVTRQPTELLQAMDRRDHWVTFGEAPALTVDEFIGTPRPVKVWYNSMMTAPGGTPLVAGAPPDVQLLGGGLHSPTTYYGPGFAGHSHIVSLFVYGFHGVMWGQLADYVAMVGLAQIKPNANLGDARTILKLFAGSPQAAPAGMSDWDQLFLKSVYATEQSSRVQRSLIARRIVHELAP